jgi:hypothetical protein
MLTSGRSASCGGFRRREHVFYHATCPGRRQTSRGTLRPGPGMPPDRLLDGRLVGDVDFAAVTEVASAITPVPGGVVPMTITMLLYNTLEAARRGAVQSPAANCMAASPRGDCQPISLRSSREGASKMLRKAYYLVGVMGICVCLLIREIRAVNLMNIRESDFSLVSVIDASLFLLGAGVFLLLNAPFAWFMLYTIECIFGFFEAFFRELHQGLEPSPEPCRAKVDNPARY